MFCMPELNTKCNMICKIMWVALMKSMWDQDNIIFFLEMIQKTMRIFLG